MNEPLEPVWAQRLPSADYAHNDLNLPNILTDGERITGVVDWDEFALGSRAPDLVVLALDGEKLGSRLRPTDCWPRRSHRAVIRKRSPECGQCSAWTAVANARISSGCD
jgi:aminoglycoside phosphotransferase (APT) family kinase protein